MRRLFIAAALSITGFTAAAAAPATVQVTVGPALQAKAEKTYGVREIDDLAGDLRASVERQLNRSGAFDGARIELVLADAKPNRPTFKELSDRPGLSLESFGLGGATIEGRAIGPDGAVTPIGYRYYENDIRWAPQRSTWGDAQWTFDRFADRLGRGAAPHDH